jgi:hypothetical protein
VALNYHENGSIVRAVEARTILNQHLYLYCLRLKSVHQKMQKRQISYAQWKHKQIATKNRCTNSFTVAKYFVSALSSVSRLFCLPHTNFHNNRGSIFQRFPVVNWCYKPLKAVFADFNYCENWSTLPSRHLFSLSIITPYHCLIYIHTHARSFRIAIKFMPDHVAYSYKYRNAEHMRALHTRLKLSSPNTLLYKW